MFHGVGNNDYYALNFSPINNLSDFKIKLNTEFEITGMYNLSNNTLPVLVKANKSFTLLEVLRGIFWELSFFGNPKDRDSKMKDIQKSCKDIDI